MKLTGNETNKKIVIGNIIEDCQVYKILVTIFFVWWLMCDQEVGSYGVVCEDCSAAHSLKYVDE